MMDTSRFVEIGRIKGAHGVHGMLKIKPYNSETNLFDAKRVVYLQRAGQFVPLKVSQSAPGPKGLRVALEGVTTREQAQSLFDAPLFIPREEFPQLDDGEFYLDDLVGMEIVDADTGCVYGKATGLLETGANEVLEVRDGDKEILIPIIDGVIDEVDLDAQRATVRLPEGLLDIYES
jgi:16S rRNA processing protein RimM